MDPLKAIDPFEFLVARGAAPLSLPRDKVPALIQEVMERERSTGTQVRLHRDGSIVGDDERVTHTTAIPLKTVQEASKQGGHLLGSVARAPFDILSLGALGTEFIGTSIGNLGRRIAGKEPVTAEYNVADALSEMADIAERPWTGNEEPENIMQRGARAAPFFAFGPASATAKTAMTATDALSRTFVDKAKADVEAVTPLYKVGTVTGDDTLTVDTIAGPRELPKWDQWGGLGYITAATLGALGTAYAIKGLKSFRFKGGPTVGEVLQTKPREVINAVPGTKAVTSIKDLNASMFHDVNAAAINVLKKAGVPAQEIDETAKRLSYMTRASAQQTADSALLYGRASIPQAHFKVKVPLRDIAAKTTPLHNRYLHLRALADELLLNQTRVTHTRTPKQATAIRSRIHDMTLQDVVKEINRVEKIDPSVREVYKNYRDYVREVRRFQASGPYGTLSKSQMRRANGEHPSMIPFTRDLDAPFEQISQVSALDQFAVYARQKIRHRIEQEAIGRYVDTVRQYDPDLFKLVAPTANEAQKKLAENPSWKRNVVSVYRKGAPDHFTTDELLADIFNIDPYYFSGTGSLAHSVKRFFESSTTGLLAPFFSVTSAIRSYMIGKHMYGMGTGVKSPTIGGTAVAPFQQMIPFLRKNYPQFDHFVRDMGSRIDSSQMLEKALGKNVVNALSGRFLQSVDDTLWMQMEMRGTGRGSILQREVTRADELFAEALTNATGWRKHFIENYRAMINSIHNAPHFNMAMRNKEKFDPHELARLARDMTGDPAVSGQFNRTTGAPLRSSAPGSFVFNHPKGGVGNVYEIGRVGIPWFNYMVQGVKRVGKEFLDKPAATTMKAITYSSMPAALATVWNRSLGPEYWDHQFKGRSDYARGMQLYLGIPGRPPEDGIEIPLFHEFAIITRATQDMMHHLLDPNGQNFTIEEDLQHALKSWASTTFAPATPPALSAYDAVQGQVADKSLFGAESYKIKDEAFNYYDDHDFMPSNLEGIIRAVAGGAADVGLTMLATLAHSEEDFMTTVGQTLASGGEKMVQKTPLLRDVVDTHIPVSNDTRIMNEMYERREFIDNIVEAWKTYWGEPSSSSNATGPGQQNTKPASKDGGDIVTKWLGGAPPSELAGLDYQNKLINPDFEALALYLEAFSRKDTPSSGGRGFRSASNRLGDAQRNIEEMRRVVRSNTRSYIDNMERDRPEQVEYLRENGVDYRKPKDVMNFYRKQRLEVAEYMLQMIQQVEDEISELTGKQLRLDQITPWEDSGLNLTAALRLKALERELTTR